MALNLPKKFSITAPGKVILHGEHSVVYGHLAIAASLNLRTEVEYSLLEHVNSNDLLAHFKMPSVNVDFSLSSSAMNGLLSMTSGSSWDHNNPQNVDFDFIVEKLQAYMEAEPDFKGFGLQQHLSMKCCLFLMVAILNHPFKEKLPSLKPFLLQLKSELPVGAGAGSSASYCVSLATVWLCLASFRTEPEKQFCIDEKKKDLISSWAFLGERIIHGNPSGIDNSICTFGSLMAFRRPNTSVKIPLHSGVRVLLVDTKVSRNTRTLVDKVAKLRGHHGKIVDTIMEAMDSISSEAQKMYQLLNEAKESRKTEVSDLFSRMEELWSMNHSLLQALGVSHPALDRIIQVAQEHNMSGKLTGAGGGGFAIILISQERVTALDTMKRDLINCGFEVKDVELGGPGVQFHLK